MATKTKVNALIKNEHTAFCENDRAWLETLDDDKLDLMVPVVEVAKTNAAEPVVVVAKTVEEYVSAAPEQFKPILVNALAREADVKNKLIDGLIANVRNQYTKDQLAAKTIDELTIIINLAATAPPDYSGRGGSSTETGSPEVPRMKAPEMPSKSTK